MADTYDEADLEKVRTMLAGGVPRAWFSADVLTAVGALPRFIAKEDEFGDWIVVIAGGAQGPCGIDMSDVGTQGPTGEAPARAIADLLNAMAADGRLA